MGSGLKPVFKPVCPECGYVLTYICKDTRMHPDHWVLSEESRNHLGGTHDEQINQVREVRRGSIPYRHRKRYRFPAHRRIHAVSGI